MSLSSELNRLKRDLTSLDEEIAVNTGPRAKTPLTASERIGLKAELQGLIQKLDELGEKLR